MLGFYQPTQGNIRIHKILLSAITPSVWRRYCGTVMQDGFVFSDTIANNISECDERPDRFKLLNAVEIANIREFIESLPLGFNTKIGSTGNGISLGQRQRLLIARAVYKNPDYLFFDEATNALDANNEKEIVNNLNLFFSHAAHAQHDRNPDLQHTSLADLHRTVVVVAHRLSTVRHADQIVVLDKGEIKEIGTHDELVRAHGAYFRLVKNQLELGV